LRMHFFFFFFCFSALPSPFTFFLLPPLPFLCLGAPRATPAAFNAAAAAVGAMGWAVSSRAKAYRLIPAGRAGRWAAPAPAPAARSRWSALSMPARAAAAAAAGVPAGRTAPAVRPPPPPAAPGARETPRMSLTSDMVFVWVFAFSPTAQAGAGLRACVFCARTCVWCVWVGGAPTREGKKGKGSLSAEKNIYERDNQRCCCLISLFSHPLPLPPICRPSTARPGWRAPPPSGWVRG